MLASASRPCACCCVLRSRHPTHSSSEPYSHATSAGTVATVLMSPKTSALKMSGSRSPPAGSRAITTGAPGSALPTPAAAPSLAAAAADAASSLRVERGVPAGRLLPPSRGSASSLASEPPACICQRSGRPPPASNRGVAAASPLACWLSSAGAAPASAASSSSACAARLSPLPDGSAWCGQGCDEVSAQQGGAPALGHSSSCHCLQPPSHQRTPPCMQSTPPTGAHQPTCIEGLRYSGGRCEKPRALGCGLELSHAPCPCPRLP